MSEPVEPTTLPEEKLSKTVYALGFVSLLMDICSEMTYTQIPIFLKYVLKTPAWVIGLIEGVSESVASLVRLYSGSLSDRMGKRKPLAFLGYSFGAISKPLLFFVSGWGVVFALRFLDRLGKGLRAAPRDALVADVTPPSMRGRAYGLHRALDSTGAVLGPLLGIWILAHIPGDLSQKLRGLFLYAGIPGFLAVLALLFFVKDSDGLSPSKPKTPGTKISSFKASWQALPEVYRRYLLISLLFTLGNSSDAFLILRAGQAGISDSNILWLYAAYNLVEALFAYPAGMLADRIGKLPLLVTGYILFTVVYLGFGLLGSHSEWGVWTLFLLYGGYGVLTRGSQKAFAADLTDPEKKGEQLGIFHTLTGLALAPASLIAGRLFDVNPAFPFILSASLSVVCCVFLITLFSKIPVTR